MGTIKWCELVLCSLVVACTLFGVVVDASSTATVTITLFIKPMVEISTPIDACIWEISPKDPGTKTKEVTLTIKANCPWKLTAKDINEISGGYMTEWTGSGYGSKKLSHPVRISAVDEAPLSSNMDEQICMGNATCPDEKTITVTLSQTIDKDDLLLSKDRLYRIMVAFVASPMQAYPA